MLKLPKVNGVHLYGSDQTDPVIEHKGRVYVRIDDKLPVPGQNAVYVRIGKLLSVDSSNVKLAKSAKKTDALSLIFYGAPANLSGFEMCRFRSKECTAGCLNTAGNGRYDSVQLARIAKTRLEVFRPDLFDKLIRKELAFWQRKLSRSKKAFLAVRLNGTTDRISDMLRAVVTDHPTIRFYDYTAVVSRIRVDQAVANYECTLSLKETQSSYLACQSALSNGLNVAAVVTRELKAQLLSQYPERFVDFDEHDLRLRDVDGVGVVGLLTPKGKLRSVKPGGFVNDSKAKMLELFV